MILSVSVFPQLYFVTNHTISSFHIFNCSNQDLWAWLPSLDNICQVCDNIVTGLRLFIIISRIITILTAILIKTSSRVFFLTEMNWECFSCFWSRIHFAGDWNYLFSQNLEIFSHFLHKSCQLWECLPVSQCLISLFTSSHSAGLLCGHLTQLLDISIFGSLAITETNGTISW